MHDTLIANARALLSGTRSVEASAAGRTHAGRPAASDGRTAVAVRGKAPLRISFAGGGTDVEPYLSERGGVVLSATINKFAYSTLVPRDDATISIRSLDLNTTVKYDVDAPLTLDGELDLIKTVVDRLQPGTARGGLDIFVHSDAPPGSGLGSSSAVVVALIGLFCRRWHLPLSRYELADLAYQLERIDLGIRGGKQDQYAAVFGGFNLIEFSGDETVVNQLRVQPEIVNELNYNLLLVYTGKTRLSSQIIETQVTNYTRGEPRVVQAMDELKQIALAMKNALLRGRLDDFGALLHDAWLNKAQLAAQITNPQIDELYASARRHGALGGKVTGAGGGGYMLVYCPFRSRHAVAEALTRLGGTVVDFSFEPAGLQTWEVS